MPPAPQPPLPPQAPNVIPTGATANPSRFNIAARNRSDALSMGTTATRNDRLALRPDEKRKFYLAATEKLSPQFSMTTDTIDINSGSFLESNHDFFLQLSKLKQHLLSYCMGDVFSIMTAFLPNGAPDDSNQDNIIDYLENYLDVTQDQIAKSNEGYRFWGDEVALENLNWSQDLLLNSCDSKLHDEVANKLYATPEESRGGPLVLYFIVQLTVKTTDRTARAIITKLQQFKLHKIPNENINTAVAIIRSAVIRLRSANRMPDDMNHIVFDIFLSSTVFTFRNHFQTLETMESPKIQTWELILKEAEQLYQRLEYEGQWNPRAKKGSVFKTTSTPTVAPTTSTSSGDNVAFPATKGKKTHDRKGNPIDRTPPKTGAPKERKKGDKTEHWCDHEKCGRWGNHPTDKHAEWYDKAQKLRAKFRERRRGAGNNNAPPTEIHPGSLPVNNNNSSTQQQHQPRLRFAATAVTNGAANF